MRIGRCLAIGMAAAGTFTALAQFTGPAPLAWRWAHSTPVSPLGAPLVVEDSVFVAVGNRIFSLDRTTGNQKWRFPLVDGIPGYFRTGPILAEGTIVAAADNRYLYGVDAQTGSSKWQWVAQVPIVGQPVLAGNIVVVQLNDDTIMGVRADNGQPAWTSSDGQPTPYKVYAGIAGGLAVHGTNILFITNDGDLTAISATARRQSWKARFSNVSPDSTPVLYGDTIYVNSGSYVVAVNAISGGPRWQMNLGETMDFSPAASAEGVFAVSVDGRAYFLDPLSGRPKSRQPLELGSVLAVRPSAIDKMFLAPLTSGALTLVDPTTQSVVWSYLVRPLNKTLPGAGGTAGAGPGARGPGGGLGGPGGPGGPGGRGGAGGGQTNTAPVAIPASGPAILVGQTLFVLISDGSLLAFDKSFGVDLTGPKVQMVWPNSGDQVNGHPPLEMIFKIDDDASGVNAKTVAVEIQGRAYEATFGRDGFAIVKIMATGVKNIPLNEGHKTIKVMATDWLGNRTTAEFALTVDNTLAPLSRAPSNTGTQGPGRGTGGGGGGGRGDG